MIKIKEYDGQEYLSRSHAARYVGMTDAGLRRKLERIERRNNIVFPIITFFGRNKYINKKILDVLRKPTTNGWLEELKNVIQEVA